MIFLPNSGSYRKPVPESKSKKTFEILWNDLIENGISRHSSRGIFLAHFLNRCVAEGISFTLHYVPGGGYGLELKSEADKVFAKRVPASHRYNEREVK